MKFLCPSCKTKYQIADEKVSGRAVRMKCRKCGYIIPISEVPPAPPTVFPPAGDALPPVPKPPPAPRGLEPPPSSRRGFEPPASRRGLEPPPSSHPMPKPVVPQPTPKPGAVKPVATPGRPVPARPTQSSPMAAQVAPKIAAAKPRPQSGSDLLPAFEDEAEEQPTAIVSGGALAAAFGKLVSTPGGKLPDELPMPADEWYVGINDVPVGPIRLAELRQKATSGAIQGDSLVWRDGLEDWRPLKTFPELVAVVEEGLSNAGLKRAPAPVPADGAARGDFGDFGAAMPSGVTGVGVVTDDLAAAGLVRQRTPIAAWFAVAAALACGVAIGAFFLARQKPPEVVKVYVDRVVPGAPAAVGAQDPAAGVAPGADSAGQKTRTGPRTGVKPVAATNGDKGGGLPGLKGLDGLRPAGGPGPGSTPGTTSPGSGSGSGQLESGQIQSTVARYTGSVKRSCWQPALDSRDPTAPASARVSVTITVGPSGSVQNVTTSGEPRGYPGLAGCIAGRVRSWQFPATGGTTTANVPFVFAAQ